MGREQWGDQWDEERAKAVLGDEFVSLGQAVEILGSVHEKLWMLSRVTNNPAYYALEERVSEAHDAVLVAHHELATDPDQPHRGEWAIAEYLRRRGYSGFAVEGGFERMVYRWEHTVTSIEKGYSGIVEEYINSLDGRRTLRLVWPLASAQQQILHGPRLEQADERFRAATDHVEESFSRPVRENPEQYPPVIRWLYHRVPRGSNFVW